METMKEVDAAHVHQKCHSSWNCGALTCVPTPGGLPYLFCQYLTLKKLTARAGHPGVDFLLQQAIGRCRGSAISAMPMAPNTNGRSGIMSGAARSIPITKTHSWHGCSDDFEKRHAFEIAGDQIGGVAGYGEIAARLIGKDGTSDAGKSVSQQTAADEARGTGRDRSGCRADAKRKQPSHAVSQKAPGVRQVVLAPYPPHGPIGEAAPITVRQTDRSQNSDLQCIELGESYRSNARSNVRFHNARRVGVIAERSDIQADVRPRRSRNGPDECSDARVAVCEQDVTANEYGRERLWMRSLGPDGIPDRLRKIERQGGKQPTSQADEHRKFRAYPRQLPRDAGDVEANASTPKQRQQVKQNATEPKPGKRRHIDSPQWKRLDHDRPFVCRNAR
jgi:hypothetical protein